MSEVDNHYGSTVAGRRGPASPSRPDQEWERDAPQRMRDRAAQAASHAQDAASSLKDRAGAAYGQATDWASDRFDTASRHAVYARRRTAAEFNRGRRQVESFVEENPIMIGVVGLAAGLLIGALLPGTRRENQVFGRYADEARREGWRYAQSVAEQGRQVLGDNLDTLKDSLNRDPGDETPDRR